MGNKPNTFDDKSLRNTQNVLNFYFLPKEKYVSCLQNNLPLIFTYLLQTKTIGKSKFETFIKLLN